MRLAALALSLLAASCAVGAGVNPDSATTSSTEPVASTLAVDDATRQAAVEVATEFFDAMISRDASTISALGVDPPATLQDDLDRWAGSIGLQGGSFVVLRTAFFDSAAEVTVRLTLDLVEVGPWSYETTLGLIGGPEWSTVWSPSALHPALEPGDVLRVDRAWPPRASILGHDGTALAGAEAVKVVGVVPARIEDLDTLTIQLASLAGIDPDVVRTELANPVVQPDWFVPVGTIKTVVYNTVGADLETLPGVLLRDGSARLPYQEDFASHLIGDVGPITADRLADLGFPYGPTDVVGRSGLEERYEEQLAGRPRTAIVRVNRFGRILEELFAVDGATPEDLSTTIDVEVQAAVEFALRDITRPAAIVVLEASTGQVRGVTSRPGDEFDRALLGTYPPGSTFKVITATGLLASGLAPSAIVACPAEVTLGGLTIGNAAELELGDVPLVTAFAASCNTTFAAQAVEALGAAGLVDLAESFGFGTEPNLGIASAASVFPAPVDTAEVAAAAIGQGRIAVSPVHMASVAAAASTGTWRPPTVIAKPERAAGIDLDPDAIRELQQLTAAVVSSGTGSNAAVAGVAVRGKTGSAQFSAARDVTHAWFIGYWDDYAIAVIVERAGGGGTVAAPLARRVIAGISG